MALFDNITDGETKAAYLALAILSIVLALISTVVIWMYWQKNPTYSTVAMSLNTVFLYIVSGLLFTLWSKTDTLTEIEEAVEATES